ncbi:MAG: hypothetical protein B7Z37_28515 [Verrucomicrobia bacterium 12-59-8]|nr:MAG: hypothetical protein B7Z37_28515 [Verrucomicrobia bacterium 12-59-8]
MKVPSPTEFDLLSALGMREVSGRDLAKRYEEETGKSMSYGTLYTAMRRLKDGGWVTARDDEDGDRRVRYFKLSGAGATALPKLIKLQSDFALGEVVV